MKIPSARALVLASAALLLVPTNAFAAYEHSRSASLASAAAEQGKPRLTDAPRQLAANALTFADTVSDSATAPDIRTVAISITDAGRITAIVGIDDDDLFDGDVLGLFLDTDQNRSTGEFGSDYMVIVDHDTVALQRWNGAAWDPDVPQSTLQAWGGEGSIDIYLSTVDIGRGSGVHFDLQTMYMPTGEWDVAPDAGVWTMPFNFPPPPPAVAGVRQAPACKRRTRRAVLNGKRVCLRRGQRCRPKLDRQYHRARFHCHKPRRGAAKLK